MARWTVAVLGLAFVVLVATPAAASDSSVAILGLNQGYSPATVTVDPGNTVTWTNRDATGAPHNAFCDSSCPEAFSSGPPGGSGASGSYTFRYSGTYTYHCAVHPNMTGTVMVTGDARPPAAAAGSGGAGGGTAPASASASSSQSGTASAVANSGASAVANATSGSTQSASATPGDQGSLTAPGAGVAGLGQLALPQPHVRVHRASSRGTSWWALIPASMVLLVAATACGVAWLGPWPRRREDAPA